MSSISNGESETRIRILKSTWRLLERSRGRGVRMRDVAEAAGVSRQAIYLHFASRAELLVATARYLDEVCGLEERLRRYRASTAGVERLDAYIEFWGNYIPEIYGVAKALLAVRETDKAAATAWGDRMGAVHTSCRNVIKALSADGMLAPGWSIEEATDFLWTMLSVRNWESLTIECGWTIEQYVYRSQEAAKRTLVRETEDK